MATCSAESMSHQRLSERLHELASGNYNGLRAERIL
jgi:hypothetical protein